MCLLLKNQQFAILFTMLAFCRDNMLRFIEKCLLVYMQLRGNVYNYYVQFYQSKSTVDNRLNKID